MSEIPRRRRTAFFSVGNIGSYIWRCVRRPFTWLTLLLWIVLNVASAYITALALSLVAISGGQAHQSVFVGTLPPSLSWCHTSELDYRGIQQPFVGTRTCGTLLAGMVNLPNGIDPSTVETVVPVTALSRPHVPRPDHQPRHPRRPLTPHEQSELIFKAEHAKVGQAIGVIGSNIHTRLGGLIVGANLVAAMLLSAATIWVVNKIRRRRSHRKTSRLAALGFVCVSSLLSLGQSAPVWMATASLASATNVNALIAHTASLAPGPSGPVDIATQAVVGGDSLVSAKDEPGWHGACWRTASALAWQLNGHLEQNFEWANQACEGGTIENGLLGEQYHVVGGKLVVTPPLISLLQHMPNLRLLVLSYGSNDTNLPNEVRVCVVTEHCEQNAVMTDEFNRELERFKADLALALTEIKQLPSHTAVVFVLPYRLMEPSSAAAGNTCPDAQHLTPAEVSYLNAHQRAVRDALTAAVAGMNDPTRFTTAWPYLKELCPQVNPGQPQVSPDIWGLWLPNGQVNPMAGHPKPSGEVAIAIAVGIAVSRLHIPTTPLPTPSASPSRSTAVAARHPLG